MFRANSIQMVPVQTPDSRYPGVVRDRNEDILVLGVSGWLLRSCHVRILYEHTPGMELKLFRIIY